MSGTNAAVSFRTVDSIKTEAFKVIKEYGFSPTQVFNLFLTEIVNTKTVPVNLSYLQPNEETLRAMKDAENDEVELISPAGSSDNIVELLMKRSSNLKE